MGFLLKRVVDLSSLGWEGCVIEHRSLEYEESEQMQEQFKNIDPKDKTAQHDVFKLMSDKFISGEGLDEKGEKTPITKDNLKNLPLPIYMAYVESLAGGTVSPN